MDDEYIPITVAAEVANIPARTVRAWVADGKLPAISGKRGKLVRRGDVDQIATLTGRADGRVTASGNAAVSLATEVATNPHHDALIPSQLYAVYQQTLDAQAAELARLDQLYREQIAAKDALIDELRRRAEHAERRPRPTSTRVRVLSWLARQVTTLFFSV